MSTATTTLPAGLRARLAALYPGAAVESVAPLGADSATDASSKGLGYGTPLRVALRLPAGTTQQLVFHQESANDYGHDRRADRAANVLLAWDSFRLVPGHARTVDVGGIDADGTLVPLGTVGELYLLTEWAEGEVYAEDLRAIALRGTLTPLDVARIDALAQALVELHRRPGTHPGAWARALRDLVGGGEGIAGIVDGYGSGAPGASFERLAAIEHQCLTWRQRLKPRAERLRRTHGDFHPFNLVFTAGSARPTLLDTSRGSQGDPADDVTCLAINLLFFGLGHRDRWRGGLGQLWSRFWEVYLSGGDAGVLEVAAPFFAWRALVLSNPAWYPHLAAEDRDRLLSFAERALSAGRFEPSWGAEAMR